MAEAETVFTKVEYQVLREVARAMIRHNNVHTLLNEVLDVLDRILGAERATLTLFQEEEQSLVIETSKGLTPAERARGRYRLGEGVTGRVAQNRQGVLIKDISQEPGFLDRTKSRKNAQVAFLCVPVNTVDSLIGTISVDLSNKDSLRLTQQMHLMEEVAMLVSEAVNRIRQENTVKQALVNENTRMQHELADRFNPSNIVGTSRSIRRVCEQLNECSDLHDAVFIAGESGTGKELAARSIHYNGMRHQNSFNLLNCVGMPANYIERELFGVESEGKVVQRGLLDVAHGGTLYIEDLTQLSTEIQARIETYIQTQTFTRIGSEQVLSRNVRLLVAAPHSPQQLLEKELLSPVLYTLLSRYVILVPPMRERKGDIVQLADYFLDEFNRSYGKKVNRISTPAINMLTAYHYPGNVLELRNCIERAVLNSSDNVIHGYNLPPSLQIVSQGGVAVASEPEYAKVTDLAQALMTYERELLVESLKKHRGNAAAVARNLSTSPRVLNYRFAKLGINLKEFKKSSSGRISK